MKNNQKIKRKVSTQASNTVKRKTGPKGPTGEHKATVKNGMLLRDVFMNRRNVFKRLQKHEAIAQYLGVSLDKVLQFSQKKQNNTWREINFLKRYLRDKKVLAIISKRVPKGFELDDAHLGKRVLDHNTFVYFACDNLTDALAYRAKLDRLAEGLHQAGEDVEDITHVEKTQQPILATVRNR